MMRRAWHLLLRAVFGGIYALLVGGLTVWLAFRRVRGHPPIRRESYE
jgi:hypothetical protein